MNLLTYPLVQELSRVRGPLQETALAERQVDILERLGFTNQVGQLVFDRVKHKQAFSPSDIYTIDQIKAVAMKFGLVLDKLENYEGTVPHDLGEKVTAFEQKHLVHLHGNNLRLLAPRAFFAPKPVIQKDPVLLYYVGRDEWAVVHLWGNDFSLWDRLKNFWKETSSKRYLSRLLFFFTLASLPWLVLHFTGAMKTYGPTFLGFTFVVVSSILCVVGLIYSPTLFSAPEPYGNDEWFDHHLEP